MASLDSLSDGEIRSKLTSLGCEVGPVTPTTRKLYIKKLKTMLDNSNLSDAATHVTTDVLPNLDDTDNTFKPTKKTPNVSSKSRSPARKIDIIPPLANSTFLDTPSKRTSRRDEVRESVDVGNQVNLNSQPTSVPSNRYGLDNDEETTASRSSFTGLRASTGPWSPEFSRARIPLSRLPLKKDFDASQPYSSDFTRQLSMSISASRLANTGPSSRSSVNSPKSYDKYDSVKENDSEDEDAEPTYTKFNKNSRSFRANGSNYIASGEAWYGKDASLLILGAFALFFLVISYIYFHMHHYSDNQVSQHVSELSYPKCDRYISEDNCIPDHDIQPVTLVFRHVYKRLQEKSTESSCDPSDFPRLSNLEIINLLTEKEKSMGVWDIEGYVKLMRLLVMANPKWNMVQDEAGVYLRNVPTSLYCTIVGYITAAADWALRVAIVVVTVGLMYLGGRWYTKKQALRKERVYKLVTDIVQIVNERSIQDGTGFAVISHVRDMLISPNDRNKMADLWKEAESILESDSRLRKEIQQVEGEDFLVWRWLASPVPVKKKGWQGQAFETMEGSPNSIPDSPTPCLKIRHMFDPSQEAGENWVASVADAVLEKCKGSHIQHIAVDESSPEGCVYVKCASHQDAGIAYKALHGSWFNGKLVTVKYIREGRYLERFPDSGQSTRFSLKNRA